jgi:hypothetical protein
MGDVGYVMTLTISVLQPGAGAPSLTFAGSFFGLLVVLATAVV